MTVPEAPHEEEKAGNRVPAHTRRREAASARFPGLGLPGEPKVHNQPSLRVSHAHSQKAHTPLPPCALSLDKPRTFLLAARLAFEVFFCGVKLKYGRWTPPSE